MWCHNDHCLKLLIQLKANMHRLDKKRKNALYWAVSAIPMPMHRRDRERDTED